MARRRKRVLPLSVTVFLILVILCVYFYYNKINPDKPYDGIDPPAGMENMPDGGNGNLNIYFLDVGQGDCIIIEFPDNKTMIIDSGNNWDSCEEKIKQFTDSLQITTFDYLLLTHADADHVGCMDYVFKNYDVKKVFRPNVLSTHEKASTLKEGINVGATKGEGGTVSSSRAYYDFLYYMQEEMCENEIFNKDSDFTGSCIIEDKTYTYVFDFLTPVAEKSQIRYKNANDYSPIVSLTYNETVVLLTGDAETEMEAEFVGYYKGNYPDCDILKIGHHGSETSTSSSFLSAVKPECAIIQCGVTEAYKHPRQAVLDRLTDINADIYRTDNNGDIAISITYSDEYNFSVGHVYCSNTDISKNLIGGDTYYNQQKSEKSSS